MSTLVIVAGQSNALTFGTKASDLPADDAKADPRAQIWNWKAQAFETLDPGHNTNAGLPAYQGAWGPEVTFSREELRAHPSDTVYYLKDKAIQGETPLARDAKGWDWSPESRGEQYDKATAQIEAARAHIPDLTKVVVLWMQGESDSVAPGWAAAYGRNLNDFIAHTKADWGADVVLIARIPDEWGADSPVRSAQDAHGAFSTDAYAMQDDGKHFAASGALQLGEDFWRAYQRWDAERIHCETHTPSAPPHPPIAAIDVDPLELFDPSQPIDLAYWFGL